VSVADDKVAEAAMLDGSPVGGSYEVLIVRYATRSTTRSEVFMNYRIHGEPDGPIDMDYFLWIARNRHHTVVIDTGFDPRVGRRRARTTLCEPARAFTALGVGLTDGPTVVLTHAHYDHIGNLSLFPNSPIVVARSELDFWAGALGWRGQFQHLVEAAEIAGLTSASADGRVQTFAGKLDVAPGIEVIEVGGHTPGQSNVRLQTSEGPV
jgi:glyoxylase-like metal-dependent hydrolase (beta-lactamase superfamily II)